MRSTAIFWKCNQHIYVYYSGSEEIQYNYISVDRYIQEGTLIVAQINLINIKWIRPFKFVRLPTKFLSMYTFAKRRPGNIENLQDTGQFFQTHLKSR